MRLQERDGVLCLHLEAGKANAMNPGFLARLGALIDEALEAGPGPLVVTGYDRFFSGGLDLPVLVELGPHAIGDFIQKFDEVMLRLFAIDRPVVAAINGHAIAGGCVLALQADYRVMAEGSGRIGLNEVQLGIGLPDSVIETLRCQVPASSLLPIALEGRLFSPQEALLVGLVHEVAPADAAFDRALAKARELGALPSSGFQAIKRSLRAPALAAAQRASRESARQWTATWLTTEAQSRLYETVAKLAAKAR